MASTITIEELQTFHKIDRELYSRLVTNLNRDPIESMQVIGLWFWLEQVGYTDIVLKMMDLEDTDVKTIAEEAVACLHCLASASHPISTTNNNIPITQNLLGTPISLQFIYENKDQAIIWITKIVNDVCVRAFEDIAQEALATAAQEAVPQGNNIGGENDQQKAGGVVVPEYLRVGNLMVYPAPIFHGPGLVRLVYRPVIAVPASALPGVGSVPQQLNLGAVESVEMSCRTASNLNPQAEPFNPNTNNEVPQPFNPNKNDEFSENTNTNDEIPENDRTMFVTFSRGYPLTEREVRGFFTRIYGDCIEDMIMQEVPPNTQPLFARMILDSPAKIGEILDGRERVKFLISGKHVCVRRYIAKQGSRPQRAAAGPRGGTTTEE